MERAITLNSKSEEIRYLSKKDKRLYRVFEMVGEIVYTPHTDPYAFLVAEIIEQMLSTKVADRIYDNLEKMCGGYVSPSAISSLSIEKLHECGISRSKAEYIKCLTRALLDGELDFQKLENLRDSEVMEQLMSIKGIGSWSAKMYLIFVLDRRDILPYEDGAFQRSYAWLYKTKELSKASIEKRCKKWKPYSSIAARYMYRALDMGFTKEEFHLFKDTKNIKP